MKKILVLLLSLLMVVPLTACGEKADVQMFNYSQDNLPVWLSDTNKSLIKEVKFTNKMPKDSGLSWDASLNQDGVVKAYIDGDTLVIASDGNLVSIGSYALASLPNVTEIKLPDTVRTIGQYGIAYNDSLSKITLPKNIERLNEASLGYNISLKEIKNLELVDNLGSYTLAGNISLEKFKLPDGIESIPVGMFYTGSVPKGWKMPNTVTAIHEKAFYQCHIEEMVLSENLIQLSKESFKGAVVRELDIPDGVQEIPISCFEDCKELSALTGCLGIGFVDDNAFRNCVSLTECAIKANVTQGGDAFWGAPVEALY